eukprot:353037-Chlamydomonas_euryale.AAC.3
MNGSRSLQKCGPGAPTDVQHRVNGSQEKEVFIRLVMMLGSGLDEKEGRPACADQSNSASFELLASLFVTHAGKLTPALS